MFATKTSLLLMVLAMVACFALPLCAADKHEEAMETVAARTTLSNFLADPDMKWTRSSVKAPSWAPMPAFGVF